MATVILQYCPAEQAKHSPTVEAPGVVRMVPCAHSVAAVVLQYMPAGQTRHISAVEAPVVFLYVPVPQAVGVLVADAHQ